MKKSIALTFAASTLFLAGCCTTTHVTKWEYKVVCPTISPSVTDQERRDLQQAFLDDLGKDGWVLVSEDANSFYFKRPVK